MPRRGRRTDEDDQSSSDPDAPLINRQLEISLLREHIARVARTERGQAVVLLGESGVGKSRLASVAASMAHDAQLRVMTAQCVGRGAEPLLPMKEALAAYLGRTPERIRRMLIGVSPTLIESLPFVGRFVGALNKSWARSERFESAGLHGVYEELARVLVGIAERQGLCLIAEDLHAADQDTLYFLHYLLKKVRNRRILVIATIQEEQLADAPALVDLLAQWTAAGDAVLTVTPLERAHVGEYAHHVLSGHEPIDDALVDQLFRLTGGNPFFLKETARLMRQAGRSEPISPFDQQMEVPTRAKAVLRARLMRADDQVRQLIDSAAVVLETSSDFDAILDVADMDRDAGLKALADGRDLRLLVEGDQGEISFTHDLMHRAVYHELGFNARRHLHQRAAAWTEDAGQLASASHHYERAGAVDDMVRTALAAAGQAEKAGMYHSALLHYRRAQPHIDPAELGPLLGRALIVLGDWEEAKELLTTLPADDGRVQLLRSELMFVLGDFDAAAALAASALNADDVERVDVLIRLADVALYVGHLDEAQDWGQQALERAQKAGSATQQARCLGIIGASAFFGQDLDEGLSRFREALELISAQPAEQRDGTIEAILIGNLANVAEATDDWTQAEQLHRQALQMRREIADARGALHSLHGLARSKRRLGQDAEAEALIDQADGLAIDLEEPLERAKIAHTRSDWRLAANDCQQAVELGTQALRAFLRCETTYDIAHARLSLSAATLACGDLRAHVEHGSKARQAIERYQFGLLRRLRPEQAFRWHDRIAASFLAYACGDALGLPWEGDPPTGATIEAVESLPARPGWPRGATSDDTALTERVAKLLVERGETSRAEDFLALLAEEAPDIKGLGPSTLAAIEHYQQTGAVPTSGGGTNGAAMRAMPIGWMTMPQDAHRRRQITLELTRATHPAESAQVAACLMAATASWAIDDADPELLLAIAREEAAAVQSSAAGAPSEQIGEDLSRVASGTWKPPPEGISLDPLETTVAVLHCVLHASSLRDGLYRAIALGGDTDTVAALVGGLLGARLAPGDVLSQLSWHHAVTLPDQATVDHLASGLAARRTEA